MKFLKSVPYENLSKAIKRHKSGKASQAPRLSSELMKECRELGTGGTCFSLSWYLYTFLKQDGIPSSLVMCDRAYGADTHCAVTVGVGEERYLLDPGFLCYHPLHIMNDSISRVETPYNSIYLEPQRDGIKYDLYTFYRNERKYRFTLKDISVPENDFMKHWNNSFSAPFMDRPVVTQLKGKKHYYLQGLNLYIRDRSGSERVALNKDNFSDKVNDIFGINREVNKQAMEIFFH
jgi:arylamine N-acetyltransferase